MADGVNSYLLFFSAGFHFLLPLSCVKRVTDMKERDPEMALADFRNFWRLKICQVRLILLLQTAEAGRLV